MMVEVSRVSIPCFLVTTIIMGLNVMKGSSQKISDRILDDILGDIANQYQSADYGQVNKTYGILLIDFLLIITKISYIKSKISSKISD